MSIGNFYGIDTTSPGKLEVLRWQKRLIEGYNESKKNKFKGLSVGLPGSGPSKDWEGQCDRHVDEYTSYGIPENRQVFVDYNYDIHRSHKKWKEDNDKSTVLMCGELLTCLHELWNDGNHINIVDYDGVLNFNQDYENVILQSAKHDVDIIIVVFTTRKNKMNSFDHKWRTKLGIPPKVWDPKRGEHRMPIKQTHTQAIEHLASTNGYDCHRYPYAGRSNGAPPMMSCVLLKK